jgi:hypothetical protein
MNGFDIESPSNFPLPRMTLQVPCHADGLAISIALPVTELFMGVVDPATHEC